MRITLRRRLGVKSIRFCGIVASPVKRAVEQSVVTWAKSRLEAFLAATAEELARDPEGPLPGRPAVLARRLLEVCERAGLLKVEAGVVSAITDAGERAVADGCVFVEEYSTWRAWWSEDSLLPHALLRLELENEPKARDEVVRPRGQDRTPLSFMPAPQPLSRLLHKALKIPAGDKLREAELREVGKCADFRAVEGADLLVELTEEGSATIRAVGQVDDARLEWDLAPPDLFFSELWESLRAANGIEASWNSARGKLRVAFDPALGDALTLFRTSLKLASPDVPELGSFEQGTVHDVPIEPATEDDAQKWADWLLGQGITDYLWPDAFASRSREVAARFPHHRVRMSTAAQLAARLRGNIAQPAEPRYWHVQAPLDLEAERV